MDRRNILSSGAVMGLGAVTGCATSSVAATDARTVFSAAQPLLPVVGTSERTTTTNSSSSPRCTAAARTLRSSKRSILSTVMRSAST